MKCIPKTIAYTWLAVTLALTAGAIAAYAANQKECKAKEAEFTGTCLYVTWPEIKCTGTKTRTTYDGVGDCKAAYNKDCPPSSEDGTYTEAVGQCVLNASNSDCHVPSWGPESQAYLSENPACNP